LCGNTRKTVDAGRPSGKSYLFFLTGAPPWNRVNRRWGPAHSGKLRIFAGSGAGLTVLENTVDRIISRPVVLITASGLQGEKPLVDRTM